MNVKIQLPESLEEITLGQYQQFLKVTENVKGEFLAQKMIEIFCNIPLSHVLLIKLTDVRECVQHITNLFEQEQKHQQRFKIKDLEFGMIPNLDDITMGEFIDLDTNFSDWENMHKAMAVLYRPITNEFKETYEIVEYKGTDEFSNLMQHAPLNVVMGASVFFYHLGNELIKASQSYLEQEILEVITAKLHNSTSNGGGITLSTHLLKENLQNLIKLLNYELEPVSLG